ncbi:hypothetical protein ACULNC_15595 [Shigella flexneri]
MEKLWLDVKRVAGQSVIFEGAEGLPAQNQSRIAKPPVQPDVQRAIHGGLLALQLSRAGAPLLACEVIPSQKNPGANCALDYRTAGQPFCRAGAGCSGFENEHLNFALATPDGTFALRVRSALHATAWLSVRKCAQ